MFRSIVILAVALACLSAGASATEQSGEMKSALHTLVVSLNIEKSWSLIVENSGKTGAAAIQRSFLASMDAKPGLTDAQRQKMTLLIKEWSVPMAEEIDAIHRAIDVTALMDDMAQAVYPKYFTPDEIRKLAAFYGSRAFQKTTEIGIRVNEESARTGNSQALLWKKYESLMTQDEKNVIAAFFNSNIGKKAAAVGPALAKDMRDFYQSRFDVSVNEVADRYGKIMAAKLKEDAAD